LCNIFTSFRSRRQQQRPRRFPNWAQRREGQYNVWYSYSTWFFCSDFPKIAQTFETLEELLCKGLNVAGSQRDVVELEETAGVTNRVESSKFVPFLNLLRPGKGPKDPTFRGRENELQQLAESITLYEQSALGRHSTQHPFNLVTSLPGTGKTTFANECLHLLQEKRAYFPNDKLHTIIEHGVSIFLNLSGGEASWQHTDDSTVGPEQRLVARVISIAFLNSPYNVTWASHEQVLKKNKALLMFRNLVPSSPRPSVPASTSGPWNLCRSS